VNDLADSQTPQSLEHLRHQWLEVFEPVTAGMEHDHSDLQPRKVLAEDEVPVHGEENVKEAGHERWQLAIRLSGPPHLRNGLSVVTGYQSDERAGQAFIKQNLH
jgi:hypothetical protein